MTGKAALVTIKSLLKQVTSHLCSGPPQGSTCGIMRVMPADQRGYGHSPIWAYWTCTIL